LTGFQGGKQGRRTSTNRVGEGLVGGLLCITCAVCGIQCKELPHMHLYLHVV